MFLSKGIDRFNSRMLTDDEIFDGAVLDTLVRNTRDNSKNDGWGL